MFMFLRFSRQLIALAHRRHAVLPWALAPAMLLSCFGNVAVSADEFEKVAIYLERNIQDEDAEVKFEASAPDVGLTVFRVVAPNGLMVIDFKAPNSKIGIRHFTLERGEPKNDGKLQADFPTGKYKFTGMTTGGATLNGEAVLRHEFPAAASVANPLPDAKNVPSVGLRVTWTGVNDVEAITVEIEQEETGQEVHARLPGLATTFAVPDEFLRPAKTYKIGIGTIARGGNKTVTESGFTTAAKK